MKGHTAKLTWRDGTVPVSSMFDDPYFSIADGLEETRHVFLTGNDLPQRFQDGFQIAELGFGTGLNALAAWNCWRESGQAGRLNFTSFEAFPMAQGDMARALDAFPSLAAEAADLLDQWRGTGGQFDLDGMVLTVIEGDARQTLPAWPGVADAWFLDGFSPAKNPELWEAALLAQVAQHTRPGGTFATYSAAGGVRRALEEAGFEVQRAPGFGRKRHMTLGVKK